MKKRALILVTLLATIVIGITAQKYGRRMIVNYGGEVVATYNLPQNIDSLTFDTYNLYIVTANSADTLKGSVTISSNTVEGGMTVILTATPNEGYEFVNWTVNGEVVSTENPYTATITQNTQYVANFEYVLSEPTGTENGYGYVDLGLPSGLKWATCNVGATSPEEYGDYFAWGETEPKDEYSWSTYKYCKGNTLTITKYCIDSEYVVDNKIVLELEDDAAYANWGGNWRMPELSELQELYNNCTWSWTRRDGVDGYKVTSKKNRNSIFLPAVGRSNGNTNNSADYWSSSLSTKSDCLASYMYFNSTKIDWYNRYRNIGRCVRAVYSESTPEPTPIVYTVSVSATEGGEVEASATEVEEGMTVTLTATPKEGYVFANWTVNGEVVSTENPYTTTITADTEFVANLEADSYNGHEYVDLGLPSGLKWATCNVGANAPEEYGDYFAWGETEPKSSYGTINYEYVSISQLPLSADAAYVNWGGNWRMPTKAEQDELRNTDKCTWEWTTQNGVNGYKVTSKVNGNFIFLPAAGYYYGTSLNDAGRCGDYWSSSHDTADSSRCAYYLSFSSSKVGYNSYQLFYGLSVRAVCP